MTAHQGKHVGWPAHLFQVTNTILSNLDSFLASKPSLHTAGTIVTVATFTHVNYPSNLLDISTVPSSPQSLMIKMKSREAIQAVSPGSHATAVPTCKSLNQVNAKTNQLIIINACPIFALLPHIWTPQKHGEPQLEVIVPTVTSL